MATAVRTDEKLWQKIKNQLLDDNDGAWNARMAQQAVKKYKQEGGKYKSTVSRKNTSLAKWTAEDWGYAGKPGASRYLPAKVRESLTPAERKRENNLKGKKRGKVPYSESVKNKMRDAGIF